MNKKNKNKKSFYDQTIYPKKSYYNITFKLLSPGVINILHSFGSLRDKGAYLDEGAFNLHHRFDADISDFSSEVRALSLKYNSIAQVNIEVLYE